MAIQRKEAYAPVDPDPVPYCVVVDCAAPVVAEVHDDDYAIALELFRGVRRQRVRIRRSGDERLFVCRDHLEGDARMLKVHWQWLMF